MPPIKIPAQPFCAYLCPNYLEMLLFESLKSSKTALWGSLIASAIIIYPNIGEFLWSAFAPEGRCSTPFSAPVIFYFIYRYLFFVFLTWILIRFNIKRASNKFQKRFWSSFLITLVAYTVYVLIGRGIEYRIRLDCFTQTVILQFLIAWLTPVLIGQIYYLTVIQKETEKEVERLRSENLQSQVEALSNQINPHFFFNSLNGLTALVADNRNEETLEYVTKLSNIFRYILQSEKKGMVRLEEELVFLDAYKYLLEVRYSGKISFLVDVKKEELSMELPVLSLLPLIENVVKHNIIDSEHKMEVRISVRDGKELSIANPVYRKYRMAESHGIGLSNLSTRYKLLTGKDIQVRKENSDFLVILPLTVPDYENIDC